VINRETKDTIRVAYNVDKTTKKFITTSEQTVDSFVQYKQTAIVINDISDERNSKYEDKVTADGILSGAVIVATLATVALEVGLVLLAAFGDGIAVRDFILAGITIALLTVSAVLMGIQLGYEVKNLNNMEFVRTVYKNDYNKHVQSIVENFLDQIGDSEDSANQSIN
jgi:hypothetical protein